MKLRFYVITAATIATLSLGLGITAAANATPAPAPEPTTATATTVDTAVAQQLSYLRDEERLAHDVYLAIAKLYPDNAAPFTRIATSEQRHYESMGLLLTRYGLPDPSAGKAAGSYANPALTQLYATLMTQAKVSLAEAYKVGVAIEQTDIADLKKLSSTAPADVKQVFANLEAGSNHHLAAFTALRDGKTLGMGNGTGMQNGRGNRGQAAQPSSGTTPVAGQGARRGGGYGAGAGNTQGVRQGNGPGAGRNGTGTRPADCPVG